MFRFVMLERFFTLYSCLVQSFVSRWILDIVSNSRATHDNNVLLTKFQTWTFIQGKQTRNCGSISHSEGKSSQRAFTTFHACPRSFSLFAQGRYLRRGDSMFGTAPARPCWGGCRDLWRAFPLTSNSFNHASNMIDSLYIPQLIGRWRKLWLKPGDGDCNS